jgi:hypothetical protein
METLRRARIAPTAEADGRIWSEGMAGPHAPAAAAPMPEERAEAEHVQDHVRMPEKLELANSAAAPAEAEGGGRYGPQDIATSIGAPGAGPVGRGAGLRSPRRSVAPDRPLVLRITGTDAARVQDVLAKFVNAGGEKARFKDLRAQAAADGAPAAADKERRETFSVQVATNRYAELLEALSKLGTVAGPAGSAPSFGAKAVLGNTTAAAAPAAEAGLVTIRIEIVGGVSSPAKPEQRAPQPQDK